MKNKIKYIPLIMIFLSGYTDLKAQDYHYQVQYSSENYSDLIDTSKTPIADIDNISQLPIGFSFNYAGKLIDSLCLKSSGLLMFDKENKYNFVFLDKEFLLDIDVNNIPLSSISYNICTDNYNRKIFKIEFKNVIIVRNEQKIHMNFQVWLHEYTNTIEFHMGAIEESPSETCLLGLINMNNTASAAVGFMIYGSPASPAGTYIEANGNLSSLSSFPTNGSIYTFTPITN